MADGNVVGSNNFSGGETVVSRVSLESITTLERCNGFKVEDGALKPDALVDRLTGTPLTPSIAAQVPFAYVSEGETFIVARDKDEALRVCDSGVWGTADPVIEILPESTPARYKSQIIIPAETDLMVYEPDSATTKVRPISLKSPADYGTGVVPETTSSQLDPDTGDNLPPRLFTFDDWSNVGANSAHVTISAPSGYKTIVDIITGLGTKNPIAWQTLDTAVDLTDYSYFVVDICIKGDPQDYTAVSKAYGLFPDDPAMVSSGYSLLLKDADAGGGSVIAELRIPKLTPNFVHRLCWKISSTATIHSVVLWPEDFYVAPSGSSIYTVELWAEAYDEDLTHKGNFLMRDVKYAESPIAPTKDTSILMVYGEGDGPQVPIVKYECVYAGKDSLVSSAPSLLLSNPSDPSTPALALDPWRSVTVSLAYPTANPLPGDEYGGYLTDILFYRQVTDYSTGVAVTGAWTYIDSDSFSDGASVVDTGQSSTDTVNGWAVPTEVEIANTPASTARYVVNNRNRIYALCLDFNSGTGKWARPTAIQVSSFEKPWAWPSITDSYSLATDGTELDGYAIAGGEGRGLAVLDDDVMVFLDREFFLLRGDNPITGWRFLGHQLVGCVSNKTIATGPRSVIWHDGNLFREYAGGFARPISYLTVDSTLIDWTKAHSAVFLDDLYVFHCYYDKTWALLIYDTRNESWRIRRSLALDLAGICCDGLKVYGMATDGHAIDVFGGNADDGATNPVRQVWTRLYRVAPAGKDVQVSQIVFDIVSSEAVDLSVTYKVIGAKNTTSETKTLTTDTTTTRHQLGINALCEFIAVQVEYTGTACPDIYYIGFDIQAVAR